MITPEGAGRMDGPETAMLEERIRALEERLHTLQEGQGGHGAEGKRMESVFDRLVPAEARRHLRAAQLERLLALRAFVDAAIKRTEDQPVSEGRPRRPESVRID